MIELAADGEAFNALAAALGEGGQGGQKIEAHVSSALRPYALAALLEQPEVLRRGPALIVATDDRSARDLAADLTAYLVTEAGALLPLTRNRLPLARGAAAAPGGPQGRRAWTR